MGAQSTARRRAVASFVVALVGLAAACGDQTAKAPERPPRNGDLLFTALTSNPPDAVENTDLYLANADGQSARRISEDPGADFSVAVRPDGRAVAFNHETSMPVDIENRPGAYGHSDELVVMDIDGSSRRVLRKCTNFCHGISWAPDGQQLAFTDDHTFVMNADGSNVHEICAECGDGISEPAWSPGGETIALSQGVNNHHRAILVRDTAIWVASPSGENARQLTNLGCDTTHRDARCSVDRAPTWSPDGSTIAFARRAVPRTPGGGSTQEVVGGVYLIDPDGSNERILWRCPNQYCQGVAPRWSPDGTSIAFAADGTDGRVHVVGVGNISDRTIKLCPVDECNWVYPIAWAPDGSRLAIGVSASRQTWLYTTRPDGSAPEQVAPDYEFGSSPELNWLTAS